MISGHKRGCGLNSPISQTLQRALSVNNNVLSPLSAAKNDVFEKRQQVPVRSTPVDLINIGFKDSLKIEQTIHLIFPQASNTASSVRLQSSHCTARRPTAIHFSLTFAHITCPYRTVLDHGIRIW